MRIEAIQIQGVLEKKKENVNIYRKYWSVLSLLNVNSRSVLTRIVMLEQFLHLHDHDAVVITETWYHVGIPDEVISPSEKLLPKDRVARGEGESL